MGGEERIVQAMQAELRSVREKRKVAEADLVLMPTKINNHWIMVEIEPCREKVRVYDSERTETSGRTETPSTPLITAVSKKQR